MGLFDFFTKKVNDAIETKTEELNKKIDDFQKKITSPKSDVVNKEMTVHNNQKQMQKKITKKFYADYSEKPYISPERDEKWIEQAELFPAQSIIPVEMMQRYTDNLLPGHVYMLYWLKKYTNKRVPVYFEYKYGIDFEKEKKFLYANGFLNEMDKPTEKGEAAIERHYIVIEKHSPPKPDRSIEGISKQILAARDNIIRNGFEEYTFIANRDCCEICKKLDGKHFRVSSLKIGVNAPPMHEGCRCSISAHSDDKEYRKWLNSL